jgi:hypothetical protein
MVFGGIIKIAVMKNTNCDINLKILALACAKLITESSFEVPAEPLNLV